MKILSEYKNICCVYCIKNKVTNMNYFGSTQNLQKRLHVHRSALRRLKHESKLMNLHYSSYGEDSFEISIIKKYTSKFPNVVFEDKLIRSHKNVYNTKHLRYDISRQGFRDLISTQIKNEEDLKTQTEVCEGCAGTCGTSEMHPCPLQCKINHDESDFCNCCLVCEQDCSEI